MRLLAVTFLFGALGIIPATILELLLHSSNLIINTFLSTAVIEECVKYLAVRAKAYHSPNLNEAMDGIVYGVAAGLGFATIENILYVLGFGTISTALIRAFLSVPSHAAYAGIMGYYVGLAKLQSLEGSRRKERSLILTGLIIAITLHGIYDTLAFELDDVAALVSLLIMTLISWAILLRLIKKAVSLSPLRWGYQGLYPYNFCTQCGTRRELRAKYCVECGHEFT